jgi:hypothetical protein
MHFPHVSINAIVFFQADLFLFAVNTWSEFLKIPFSHEEKTKMQKARTFRFARLLFLNFFIPPNSGISSQDFKP